MTDVCEHVPIDKDEAVAVQPGKSGQDWIAVHCPCCGLGAWRAPDDDLIDDFCPYCEVQAVPS